MSNSGKGCIILALIILIGIIYYFSTMTQAPEQTVPVYYQGETVEHYLNDAPFVWEEPLVRANRPAPDFVYATMDNEVIRLSDYEGEKPVLIFFSHLEREPAEREFDELREFYEANKGYIELIMIWDDPADAEDAIRAKCEEYEFTFPILHDPTENLRYIYPHDWVPTHFFVSIDGHVLEIISQFEHEIARRTLEIFAFIEPED